MRNISISRRRHLPGRPRRDEERTVRSLRPSVTGRWTLGLRSPRAREHRPHLPRGRRPRGRRVVRPARLHGDRRAPVRAGPARSTCSSGGVRTCSSTCPSTPATPGPARWCTSSWTTSTRWRTSSACRVTTQPWGREVELTDPDGNRLRVAGPAPAGPAPSDRARHGRRHRWQLGHRRRHRPGPGGRRVGRRRGRPARRSPRRTGRRDRRHRTSRSTSPTRRRSMPSSPRCPPAGCW